jgi:hypothetical protein
MPGTPDPDAVRAAHRQGHEAMIAKYGPEILRQAGRKGYQAMIARTDPVTRREWCRQGYAAMIARYPRMPQIAGRAGFRRLVARVGAEQAFERLAKALACRPPTSLEVSTAALLTQLGLQPGQDYLTQQVVSYREADGTLRYAIVDFLGIHARWIIEPGHTRWHGDATQTLDGQDHTARDERRLAGLARSGYTVLALTEADLAPAQQDGTLARMKGVITQAPPTGPHLNNPAKEL